MQRHRPDAARLKQLKAFFHKYAPSQDTALVPKTIALPGAYAKISKGFTADFTACLKDKLGLELVYHASGDKPPYGYTVIDHATKMVVIDEFRFKVDDKKVTKASNVQSVELKPEFVLFNNPCRN